MLRQLQTPEPAKDSVTALETLRSWSRWLRRSEDLGLSRPDPTILARGLTSIVQPVLEGSYEANFLTSLIRNSLKIDTVPTNTTIQDYLHHLLAEMEGMATGSGQTGTTSASTTSLPRIKELRAPAVPSTTPTSSPTSSPQGNGQQEEVDKTTKRAMTPCRYFGKSAKGCTRGNKCPYKHSWEGLEQKDRCLACGAKGHMARDCPTKKPPPPRTPRLPTAPPTTPQPKATSSRSVRIDEEKNQTVEPATPSTTTQPAAPSELKEVLAEASKVLKAISTAQAKTVNVVFPLVPRMGSLLGVMNSASTTTSMDGHKEDDAEEDARSIAREILDSGASNPLRPAHTGELESTSSVKVTLAGEDTKILNQTPLGTIVVQKNQGTQIQPIVPLGALMTELGCTLHWTKSALRLHHPRHGRLKVTLKNNCPEVAVADAMILIRELEERELAKLNNQVCAMAARLEVLEEEEKASWFALMQQYVNSGKREVLWKAVLKCPYLKDLPSEVQELLVEDFNSEDGLAYMKALPLSRRERKKLMASNSWVLHLYAGEPSSTTDPLRVVNACGKVLVEIDIMSSRLWDLNRQRGAYQLLLWAACQGKIDDILGGPPCRTYSALLHRPREGYPEPARSSLHPYGLPEQQPRRQTLVHCDTALAVKQLLLWNLAHLGKKKRFVGFFFEHPRDPVTYMSTSNEDSPPDYPSWWRMQPWTTFMKLFDMFLVTYDPGALGHKARKPTTSGTNYEELKDLDGLVTNSKGLVPATALPSDQLARWAVGLRRRLATAISGPVNFADVPTSPIVGSMKKLSSVERTMWKQHLENHHIPYRSDCAVCLNAQAPGRPHRKVTHPSTSVLAVDVAGPFKHKGRDMDFKDYRYLLVGAYRFPKSLLHVVGVKDYEREIHVDDHGDEVDGAEDMMEETTHVPVPKDDEEHWDAVEEEKFDEPGPPPEQPELTPKEAKEALEEKIDECKGEVEMVTVYLSRPLRRRTGPSVLTALQEMILQITREGLVVRSIHSDRAKEFKTLQLRTWLAEHQISHTRTSGSEAPGNSTAELGVKWHKARARALLSSSSASPSEWPLAAAHAAALLWQKVFPSSCLFKDRILPFGKMVWFRAKGYRGVKEKKSDEVINKELPIRWKKGKYVGPTMDVSGGHYILRDDGGISIAKGVRSGIVEPQLEDPPLLEEEEVELQEEDGGGTPTRRVRRKASVRMIQVEDEDLSLPQGICDSPTHGINHENVTAGFEEMDLGELESERLMADRNGTLNWRNEASTVPTTTLRKAEVQFTKDIEAVLEEIVATGRPLQVVHNVSLEDVKANMEKWTSSARKEYHNLKDGKEAFDVVKREHLPPNCRIVPGKAVFTVKPDGPSFKRKTRLVACGNYVPPDESLNELYAAGLDSTTLRTMLAHTATRVKNGTWCVGATDIRQAFVLAPWVGSAVAIQPPGIALKLGLAEPGDHWLVKKSLYGLREAPAIWANFRDAALRTMSWNTIKDGKEVSCHLEQLSSDEQVWKMKVKGSDEVLGYVLVYVDDVLMIGQPPAVDAFYRWLADQWECDGLTYLSREAPIRFLGMELYLGNNGFELAQYGFVTELLRAHGHDGRRSLSQGNRDAWLLSTEEEEALLSAAELPQVLETPELRLAQRRVGELLWLTSRTRPDLQYATSILASRVSKAPELVNELGKRLLDYLEETKHYRLNFNGLGRDGIVEIYTDSSFSPSSSRSHGSAGVFYLNCPLTWRSARQPMVTLSTAESELVESIEGALMGYSVKDLIHELTGVEPILEIHIDNQAALALLRGSTGSWRTRHLRLRSNWIREKINGGEITAVREPGSSQRADIGTKPLTRDRLQQLVDQWGMTNAVPERVTRVSRFSSSSPSMITSVPAISATWLGKLATLCTWCFSQAAGLPLEDPEDSPPSSIPIGVPWEFYTACLQLL